MMMVLIICELFEQNVDTSRSENSQSIKGNMYTKMEDTIFCKIVKGTLVIKLKRLSIVVMSCGVVRCDKTTEKSVTRKCTVSYPDL